MKIYQVKREFDCAFGNLFPAGSLVTMQECNSDFCKFGLSSEVENGKPLTIFTGINYFNEHCEQLSEEMALIVISGFRNKSKL
jgi:hypothetical protein